VPDPKSAVLIAGFGAPENVEDVPAFLERVTRGRNIPPARVAEVTSHYEAIGGSPYNRAVAELAAALQTELGNRDKPVPVYTGMRHWDPLLEDTLARMSADGITHAAVVTLAPHHSPASTGRYDQALDEAVSALGDRAPALSRIDPWHVAEGFTAAVAARAGEACLEASGDLRGDGRAWIFTAHSIPTALADHCPYQQQFRQSAAAVSARLGIDNAVCAFQSRSGNPGQPWLGPDLVETIAEVAKQGSTTAVVVPVGFVVENLELLYDLDIDAAARARESGINMIRARAVGTHPDFVTMLARRARDTLATRGNFDRE
jgi:ferrochelatase